MQIVGHGAPDDLIRARGEFGQRQANELRIRLLRVQIALIHLLSVRVKNFNCAEYGLDRLGEPHPQLFRRRCQGLTSHWFRVIEQCVGIHPERAREREKTDYGKLSEAFHVL